MLKPNQTSIALPFFLLLLVVFNGVNVKAQNAKSWLTPAEQTDYKTTPRYNETLAYLTRLDNASPNIKLTSFGKSGEGRDLLLVMAAKNDAFTPEKARQQGKVVVLIQACIHAGESDGKDAGLALLADIAVNKTEEKLLDKVVLLFEPIYNVDGHEERFGAFNRINQNGPEETGFRANARNINLNRDYLKADEPETRSWLKLWNQWQPDFFIDCHVTDGADYQYNLTYQFEHHQTVAPAIKTWLENAVEKRAVPAAEADGNLLSPYLSFRDNRDLSKGIEAFLTTGRYATGYPVLRNRPAVLIETHMLKPYKNRVRATYDFIRAMLAEINRDPNSLLSANKSADAETLSAFQTYNANNRFPLALSVTDKSTTFPLKAVATRTELSEISGDVRVIFDSSQPVNLNVPYYNETSVATAVAPPLAYLVPPQWADVIERLELHNLRIERLTSAQSVMVETYRLTQPKWAPGAFESRIMLRDFKLEKITGVREFPAGSALVRLQQPAARVAIHLLEPNAPDSLVHWGFFNSIFEQKEYGENYVLEKMAREMLAKDVNLRREFEDKLKTDSSFAASPNARLSFFLEHSPYADKNIGLYPVGRVLQNVMVMQNIKENKKDKKDKKDKKIKKGQKR